MGRDRQEEDDPLARAARGGGGRGALDSSGYPREGTALEEAQAAKRERSCSCSIPPSKIKKNTLKSTRKSGYNPVDFFGKNFRPPNFTVDVNHDLSDKQDQYYINTYKVIVCSNL